MTTKNYKYSEHAHTGMYYYRMNRGWFVVYQWDSVNANGYSARPVERFATQAEAKVMVYNMNGWNK